MRIIIIGAGEVGHYLAKGLSTESIDVTVIDCDENRLASIKEGMDVQTVHGNGSSLKTLKAAGAESADILIAVTNSDQDNMLACMISRVYFPIERVIARVRNDEFTAPPILQKMSIDMAISPEKEAADKILKLLRIPNASEVLDFEQGKVWLVGYQVSENSPLLGRHLKDMTDLRESAVLLTAIMRDERVQIPNGDDMLEPGDTVYAIAPHDRLSYLKQFFANDARETERIVIIGGSMIGKYLAQQLEKEHISVKLIEPDMARCHYLSEILDNTVVLHGDPTQIDFLLEENMDDMDVCIAVSDDEQTNLVVSLLAKRLGARRTICSVVKSELIPVANSIGIDAVISPRLTAASTMLQFIRQGDVLSVGTLRDNEAEAIEVLAQASSTIVNKPLSQINFPKDAIIAAIIRPDDEIVIPQGSDMIIPGDRVIIFTLSSAVRKVEKALKVKARRVTGRL